MYRLRLTTLIAIVTTVACESRSGAVRVGRDSVKDTLPWTVSPSGLGGIQAGMSRSDLLSAIGAPPQKGTDSLTACEYAGIPESPLSGAVAVMLVNDTVVRVDIDSASVATRWGDRVGDAEDSVMARHAGHVRVEPHKYTGPRGHYLIITAAEDSAHRLIFETDGQRVTRYRAGRRPEVDWVEGCS
jgi:hypothetical protein